MKKILKFIKDLFTYSDNVDKYDCMSHIGRMYIRKYSKTKEGRSYLLRQGEEGRR